LSVSRLQLKMTNDDRHYDLTLTAVDGGAHQVEVTGVDANGEQFAELKGTLPTVDLKQISKLLASAISNLPRATTTSPTLDQRRAKHSNSHQPWTAEDDQRLRERAASPGVSIKALMQELGRSRAAIEARLTRLRIDIEVPYETSAGPAEL
jgi:hypothetical protein